MLLLMQYRLDIPAALGDALDALPVQVRQSLWEGLRQAAQALTESDGKHGWGERVEDFLPPMFIVHAQGHRLLYEVDTRARALLVRSLAYPAGQR
jgi:hypothetical protein